MNPTKSIYNGFGNFTAMNTVYRFSDELFGSDNNTKSYQHNHSHRVVQAEHVIINMDPADLQQALKAPQHVEHAVARRRVARVGPEPLASPPSPRGSQGPSVRRLADNGGGWGRAQAYLDNTYTRLPTASIGGSARLLRNVCLHLVIFLEGFLFLLSKIAPR